VSFASTVSEPARARRNLVGGKLERALHPGASTPLARIQAQQWRQGVGQRVALEPVAAQEAAHDARLFAAPAVADHPQTTPRRSANHLFCRHRRQVEVTSQQMLMAVGKHDNLAGLDLDRLPVRDLRCQAPFDDVVVKHEVLGTLD
jgi:hypothetical protein